MERLGIFVFSSIPLIIDSLESITKPVNELEIIGCTGVIANLFGQISISNPNILIADDSCLDKAEFLEFTITILKKSIGKKL